MPAIEEGKLRFGACCRQENFFTSYSPNLAGAF